MPIYKQLQTRSWDQKLPKNGEIFLIVGALCGVPLFNQLVLFLIWGNYELITSDNWDFHWRKNSVKGTNSANSEMELLTTHKQKILQKNKVGYTAQDAPSTRIRVWK